MSVLDRLFSLDRLSLSDPSVTLEFALPLPPWAWFLAIVAAAALAAIGYARTTGPGWARAGLGACRLLVLLLIVFVLAGPRVTRPNERIERDWLVYLYDRSASMSLPDAPLDGTRVERTRQLESAISASAEELDLLEAEREVLHLGFDAGVFDVDRDSMPLADGSQTRLGRAISQALARVEAKPVAGVVVFSDGRSGDTIDRATLRRLTREKIPVVGVPLGSETPLRDSAIRRVRAPQFAFIKDSIPVQLELDVGGPLSIELIDESTGIVLDERRIEPTGEIPAGQTERREVVLSGSSEFAGVKDLRVLIRTDGEDLVEDNNRETVQVELVDRPLRVLYLEGYPRWEYRYIKNLLVREASIESTVMLLSLRRRYIQEGDTPVASLPDSPEAWAEYDVVILGDLRPELLGSERAAQLRDLVALRGGGLIWIGGTGATPSEWKDTDLEALLPMSLSGSADAGGVSRYREPVTMRRTEAAERLGLLALGENASVPWPARLTDHATGWSRLFGAQRITPGSLKPTAEVLAEAVTESGDTTPLVMSMRFGAGRVLYVGTDETWRWRYALGDALIERFWIPLARVLGREGLARTDDGLRLGTNPVRAAVGESVVVTLDVADESVASALPDSVRLEVSAPGAEASGSITLLREQRDAGPPTFRGTWIADRPGQFELVARDPALGAGAPSTRVVVINPNDERRFGQTDHANLAAIAEQTGGAIVPASQLSSLSNHIPNRSRRVSAAPDIETIWDTPLVLGLFLALVLLEWVGRRLLRLA